VQLHHQPQLVVHVLHEAQHLVVLPVPDVKRGLLQVLNCLLTQYVLWIERNISAREVLAASLFQRPTEGREEEKGEKGKGVKGREGEEWEEGEG